MKSEKTKSATQEYRNERALELVLKYQDIGWTNTDIAKHCNVALSTIRRWFEGSSPNLSTLRRLETIQTGIERDKRILQQRTGIDRWFANGGHEKVKHYKELSEALPIDWDVDVDSEEWKEYQRLHRHYNDGCSMGLVKIF